MFTHVCLVLFQFCLSTCMCVCLQVQGPLRECPWAGRFRLPYYCTSTCVRSWCNWRASCVMMIAYITIKSSLVPLIEGLCGFKTKRKKNPRQRSRQGTSPCPGCQRSSCGSVRRGRGGDHYSQQRTSGEGWGSGNPRLLFEVCWHEETPGL